MLATLPTEHTEGLLARGEPAASALNSGYHPAYLGGAGFVGVARVIALPRTPVPPAMRTVMIASLVCLLSEETGCRRRP